MRSIFSKLCLNLVFMLSRRISSLYLFVIKKLLAIFYFLFEGIFTSISSRGFYCLYPFQLMVSLVLSIFIMKSNSKFTGKALAFACFTDFVGFLELIFLNNDHGSITSKFMALALLLKCQGNPLIGAKAHFASNAVCAFYFILRSLENTFFLDKILLGALGILAFFDYLNDRNQEIKNCQEKSFIKMLSRQAKMSTILSKRGQSNALMIDPSTLALEKKSFYSSVVSMMRIGSSNDKLKMTKERFGSKTESSYDVITESKDWIDYFVANFILEELDSKSILLTKTSFEHYLLNLSNLITKDIDKIKEKETASEEIVRGSGFLKENKKNHTVRNFKFKIFVCFDDYDKKPLLILTLKDRTLKQENKKLKSFDQFKDKLLGIVVHDMRAPLSMVLSSVEASRHCRNVDDLKENLKMAEINAKLLDCLISDILDYSLFKEQRLSLVCKYFLLPPILEESMSLIKLQAFHKKVSLNIQNTIQPEKLLYSDQRRLKQVLINLFTNAIKFTQSGSITLKVQRAEEFEDAICFEVIDTGSGIKKENIDKLGEAFATFDVPEGLNKQGIGLGLYISRTIVSQIGPMKNFIINSEEGKGTSFMFYMFEDLRNDYRMKDLNLGGFERNPTFYAKGGRAVTNKTSLAYGMESMSQHHSDRDLQLSDDISADLGSNELEDYTNIPEHSFNIRSKIEKNPFLGKHLDSDPCTLVTHSFFTQNITASDPRYKDSRRQKEINLLSEKEINIPSSSRTSRGNLKNITNIHVLIADDNIFNTLVLESLLKKLYRERIQIEKASDGMQALEAFKKFNKKLSNNLFHIIFMDFLMPIMDGYKATRSIKELAKNELLFEPVIIAGLSAMTCDEKEKLECFCAGMDFIFQKPIREHTLIEFIKVYLVAAEEK